MEEINTFNPEVPSSPEGPCGEKRKIAALGFI